MYGNNNKLLEEGNLGRLHEIYCLWLNFIFFKKNKQLYE